MSLKPPSILAPTSRGNAVDVLEYEVMQEKASTLGRLTRAFEQALAALKSFEAEQKAAGGSGFDQDDFSRRERLLDEAGEALWHFVVQREICGLRNTEAVLREYQVPAALRLRMGVARRCNTEGLHDAIGENGAGRT